MLSGPPPSFSGSFFLPLSACSYLFSLPPFYLMVGSHQAGLHSCPALSFSLTSGGLSFSVSVCIKDKLIFLRVSLILYEDVEGKENPFFRPFLLFCCCSSSFFWNLKKGAGQFFPQSIAGRGFKEFKRISIINLYYRPL